jgi:CheY-like chemotaxis protein
MMPSSGLILLLETNGLYRETLAAVLRSQGFVVDEVTDITQASSRLNRGLFPDIIITSARLPSRECRIFCRRLRNDLRYRNIPVIIVSEVTVEMIQDEFSSATEFGESVALAALLEVIKSSG